VGVKGKAVACAVMGTDVAVATNGACMNPLLKQESDIVGATQSNVPKPMDASEVQGAQQQASGSSGVVMPKLVCPKITRRTILFQFSQRLWESKNSKIYKMETMTKRNSRIQKHWDSMDSEIRRFGYSWIQGGRKSSRIRGFGYSWIQGVRESSNKSSEDSDISGFVDLELWDSGY
jgi:hypothetical protein